MSAWKARPPSSTIAAGALQAPWQQAPALAVAHGGPLEVESEQGQGSTFSLSLPRPSPGVERERAPESPVH